ncbi:MAG TPA: hypothetical protein PLF41_02730, partial [Anaerolineales bacterium]|nr:hypothetical protein [Anaerolineales bacterium]
MESMPNFTQLNIVKAFVDKWKSCISAKNVLLLTSRARLYPKDEQGKILKTSFDSMFAMANSFRVDGRQIDYPDFFSAFSAVDFEGAQVVRFSSEIDKDAKFDLIVGDLPFGMDQVDAEFKGEKIKVPRNWAEILQALLFLEDDGTALYLMEPLGFSTIAGQKIEKLLNKNGFFASALFNAPEKILQPTTSITPIVVTITKKATPKLFVAELLNENQAEQIVDKYFASTGGDDLKIGKYIDAGSYHGFSVIKIKQQIERLETQYKNYTEYSLGNLAIEINYVKAGGEFQEKDNAIYIPKIGKSPVVSKLSDAKLKHQNYFQVVLREVAFNEYVSAFFKSTLGQLILNSLTSQTFIAHLNKKDLEQALVALPKPEEQRLIVDTQKTLSRLKSAIDEFDTELALNPTSSNSIQKQLDTMLDAIGGLTDADKVYGLIREGESKRTELKETLSLDVKKRTKEKYIETSALKTVVAFLNTEGGIL